MKKIKLLIAAFFCTSLAFGQLEVHSDGNVQMGGETSLNNGLTVKGMVGAKNRGTLCVMSSRTHPDWDPVAMPYLSLISAQSKTSECPFANYYNGYVNFRLMFDGSVYTKYGLIQSSDSICKENVTPLPPSTLNKIRSLNGVSFNYIENNPEVNDSAASLVKTFRANTPLSAIQQQIESEKNRKRIGLIAQDVEKIYPEVVRTQIDGTKGILYSDLVAVLIEGMKEQSVQMEAMQQQIETLQEQVETLQNGKEIRAPKQDPSKNNSKMFQDAVLYQNTPNPFNQETQISYRLPANATTASICIYNLNGQQLKKHPLSVGTQNGSLTISASEYMPGMYIYALVINNQVMDSKRMALTD